MVIWVWAEGASVGATRRLYRFLGDISYPLYMVHYPIMYLYYAWLGFPNTFRTFGETWYVAVTLFFVNIALAYVTLKWFDEPVRRWLRKRFM